MNIKASNNALALLYNFYILVFLYKKQHNQIMRVSAFLLSAARAFYGLIFSKINKLQFFISKWWYWRIQEYFGESGRRPCWCFGRKGRFRLFYRHFFKHLFFQGRQSVRQTCLCAKRCWFWDAFLKVKSSCFQGNYQPVTVSYCYENQKISRISLSWFQFLFSARRITKFSEKKRAWMWESRMQTSCRDTDAIVFLQICKLDIFFMGIRLTQLINSARTVFKKDNWIKTANSSWRLTIFSGSYELLNSKTLVSTINYGPYFFFEYFSTATPQLLQMRNDNLPNLHIYEALQNRKVFSNYVLRKLLIFESGECVSPLKTCKGDLCQCDMDFAIEIQKVQHHWSEEFSLENGFDREARCQKRTLDRTNQQHESNGPGRSTNNLNCCNRGLDAKIFNPEVWDCCPDGNIAPAGTCAEGGFVKVIGLPWSVFL